MGKQLLKELRNKVRAHGEQIIRHSRQDTQNDVMMELAAVHDTAFEYCFRLGMFLREEMGQVCEALYKALVAWHSLAKLADYFDPESGWDVEKLETDLELFAANKQETGIIMQCQGKGGVDSNNMAKKDSQKRRATAAYPLVKSLGARLRGRRQRCGKGSGQGFSEWF